VALALVLALAGEWLLAPTVASAADTWTVQVGGGDETNGTALLAFFPDPLSIHAGDTVKFSFADPFHTVTFNSNLPPKPFIVPGPGSGELMFGAAALPYQAPDRATYSGSEQISSGIPAIAGPPPAPGAPPPTFSVTFTRPGVFGFVCELHQGMRGTIRVEPAGETLDETPDQAATRGQLTMGALLTKARADIANVRPQTSETVHTAVAGRNDGFEVGVYQFLPGSLTVAPGDWVVWAFPDVAGDPHTVTFTSGAPSPESLEPRPQASGPPQFVIPANVAQPQGGTTYTGEGYVNSGLLGNQLGPGLFALRFDAPPGRYDYVCLIHGAVAADGTANGMKGTITVAE
jgi:plastocyanin